MSAVMDPSQRGMRPAYVRFSRSSREDREATLKAGHVVETHYDIALITPPGSRDVVERDVPAWMESLALQVRDGAIPAGLADYYQDAYQRWCKGQEIPPDGTPILGWQLLLATEQQRVIGANILTVEDLADAGHHPIQEIGAGAPAMVAKAKHWIEVGRSVGGAALAMAALEAKCSHMEREIQELRSELAGRKTRSDKGVPRGPRRPKNGDEPPTDSSGGRQEIGDQRDPILGGPESV